VRLGAVWNRYGDTKGNLGEDWPRALTHELGHYLFYLDDNYLGVKDGVLTQVNKLAPGAMSNPYRGDYGKFHPSLDWLPNCGNTLSNLATRRADWSTITTFYPWLHAPTTDFAHVEPGPSSLPLDVTEIVPIP